MDHAIIIDGSETRATPNERLEALKGKNLPTLDNQQLFGDGDLNKIMGLDLYEATEKGDVEKFIDALENVSESRKLALSLIFDQVTPSGNSLLHVAASSGKDDVMELILNHFPYTVTRKNSSEDTPLHVAVRTESLEATKKLIRLRRGLEILYWKNNDSKSPLYLAAETGNMKILQLLLEASARDEAYAVKIQGMSPVFAALQESNLDMLKEIIDRLPKLLHVRDEGGRTPLHFAASVGNAGAVQHLLSKCPDLALQRDKNGSYPIHIACEGGNVDIICKLAKIWPDLAEIKNKEGRNILHVAAKAGNSSAIQYILKECGNPDVNKKLVNSKDVDGNTPLHLASMHNHCEVLLYLTRYEGSHLRLRNNHNLTARDVAMKSGTSSTKYSAALAIVILMAARVPRTKGREVQSPREQSCGAGESSRIEWIKKEIDTRLVVATLVASVTFTAGITLPGGYNQASDPNPGLATMMHNRVFQVFVIFNALATYSSILSVVTLIWAHNADLSVAEEFYNFTELLLSWAVTCMTVAFSAASILAVSKVTWLAIILLCFAVSCLFALLLYLLLTYASIHYFPRFVSNLQFVHILVRMHGIR